MDISFSRQPRSLAHQRKRPAADASDTLANARLGFAAFGGSLLSLFSSNLAMLEKRLLFLVLLFLPTQLGRHFWPEFSHVYSLRVDYLAPTIYFWDLLAVSLLTVFILQKKTVNRLALNLFLFFVFTQSLSVINSVNLGAGLVRLEQYVVTGLFGVYIASLKWEDLRKALFLPISISIIFESALAISQFLFEGSIGFWLLGERAFTISTPGIAKFNFQGIELLRPYGTFPHPNTLAAFLLVTIPLLSFWRPQADRISEKMLSLRSSMTTLGVLLGGLAIILTVSRTVIVAGFMASLLILTKKWKMMLVFLVLVLSLSPFLYTRFASVFDYDNLSLIRREEFINTSLTFFTSSPIFGIGLNNFIPVSSSSLSSGENRFLQPVHNIFLLTLSETGLIGVIGLMGLMGYPIFKLFRLRTANRETRTFLLTWFVTIFLGLFDHYFLTQPQGLRLLFLIWGLTLAAI